LEGLISGVESPTQGKPVQRKFRLTGTSNFKRVRRLGKSYAHPLIVLIVTPNDCDHSRFAIAAGRSVGNAVERNRAKRRLREAIRPYLLLIFPGWDVLVLARSPILSATYQRTQEALIGLLRKASLLNTLNDRR
jgi:ribonuclease P protein component